MSSLLECSWHVFLHLGFENLDNSLKFSPHGGSITAPKPQAQSQADGIQIEHVQTVEILYAAAAAPSTEQLSAAPVTSGTEMIYLETLLRSSLKDNNSISGSGVVRRKDHGDSNSDYGIYSQDSRQRAPLTNKKPLVSASKQVPTTQVVKRKALLNSFKEFSHKLLTKFLTPNDSDSCQLFDR
ncbi:hypothetical protein M9H77_02576 [Catharanthus roseus]|uniref:Uncharacterized protein n=1 Tax=Catharanthus roseus TaxID=4058 RepID=A0ACC0C8R9_CATRO|nr:hypothetical protein M9H77_02576 [Catharanthus roseus]